MDHTRAPLWEALIRHKADSKGNFHVPGHKAGQDFDPEGLRLFADILSIDRTEIGELDDLHAATGVIREAEVLAADAFGADMTRFLVGGTTAGNLASVYSLCDQGDIILVHRSCHISVFNGCMLSGAKIVPIPYEFDPVTGMELPLSLSAVENLLATYPMAKGVVITSPSYFGVVQPISELANLVHKHGIPLIVDQAHGAHFGFHPDLPESAIHLGADVVNQSTHKMLTSLTMSSMLHIKGKLVNERLIQQYLSMLQSSSPSYPLMASLDLARRQIVLEGKEKIDQVLTWLRQFRQKLSKFQVIEELKPTEHMDAFKLTLSPSGRCTGYELAELLEQRGIYIELSDDQKVLLVFSLATKLEDLQNLAKILMEIDVELGNRKIKQFGLIAPPELEGEPISYAECRTKEQKLLPIEQAVGRKSAVQLVPYPPGIPMVLMGEVIRQEVVTYLLSLLQLGGNVRGIKSHSDGQHLVPIYI